MATTRRVRPYVEEDRAACLAIFDSNTPTFFGRHERHDFASYLEKQPGTGLYFVVEGADGVVACGGWGWRDEQPRIALLCWGMAERRHQRQGIGTLLLEHRLAEIRQRDFDVVEIVTSQHTSPFFARAGFVEVEVQCDLFAPGLHGYRMRAKP